MLDGDAVGPPASRCAARSAPDTEPAYASTDVWLTSDVKPITPPDLGFTLLTDKAPLSVGGTVRALVVTPTAGGHALFTIEGHGLHAAKAVPAQRPRALRGAAAHRRHDAQCLAPGRAASSRAPSSSSRPW